MLTAAEAAKRLGISPATLYAYVSRGLIRSVRDPKNPRNRLYSVEDVERRRPANAAERALHWGGPVLESAITLISGDHLYYRGQDVAVLARSRSVEEVASLIWTGNMSIGSFALTPLHVIAGRGSTEGLPFTNRGGSILPIVAARDPLAYDLRPHAVAQTGWRILNLLTSVAAESPELASTVDETLQKRWTPRVFGARDLIRAALILCADHELNVSSFAARCVASAGSNPYAVVAAGLTAIEGNKHGGMTARIETMMDELRRTDDLRAAMADRMRRGETIYGFGHRLYPNGDPRAALLMKMLRERMPKSKELAFATQVANEGEELLGEKPTIDFALVALAMTLKFKPGVPLALFALGRTIGWIGHAIEQYGRDEIIRPRARYTGPVPLTSP
ncbi:MAG TPA: citrate synthase family protein [Thermoanaerobaculia bacterium]|nr:citrate synthase family protein [Thermoanaerobaculia bacterium]